MYVGINMLKYAVCLIAILLFSVMYNVCVKMYKLFLNKLTQDQVLVFSIEFSRSPWSDEKLLY